MKGNIWNEIMDGIDETLVDEALDLIRINEGKKEKLVRFENVKTARPETKTGKTAVWRSALLMAAAFAVIIGAGIFIKYITGSGNIAQPPVSAANRFDTYDFSAYNDPIVYSKWEIPDSTPPDGIIIPEDRYGLVANADAGVVVNIKSVTETEKLFPAAASECIAEVQYTAFGDIEGTKNISVFIYPDSWGRKGLDVGADYFLLLQKYESEENSYKLASELFSVYGINDDFTVTAYAPYEAAMNYTELSLADLVHDLTEAFESKEKPEKQVYPLEKIYDCEEWEDWIDGKKNPLDMNFVLPEFPQDSFRLYREFNYRDQQTLDHIFVNSLNYGDLLIKCYTMKNIYLADLSGDGIREICCTAENFVGYNEDVGGKMDNVISPVNDDDGYYTLPHDTYTDLYIYDFAAKKRYKLFDLNERNFELTEKDGELWVNIVSADGKTEQKKLTLSMTANVVIDDEFNASLKNEKITVNGEPMPFSLLKAYPIESRSDALRTLNRNTALPEFLDSLGIDGVDELYYRAHDLTYYRETDLLGSLPPTASARASISMAHGGYTFYETGYTSESFYNALRSVFSDSLVSAILDIGCYYSYNGELYYRDMGEGVRNELHSDYELIFKDNGYGVYIRETIYCAKDDSQTIYDPEKKDEYDIYYADCRLYNNLNVWRFESFSAAGTKQSYEKPEKGWKMLAWGVPYWISTEPSDCVFLSGNGYISLLTGEKTEYNDILNDGSCVLKNLERVSRDEDITPSGSCTTFPYEGLFHSSRFRGSYNEDERCAMLSLECPSDVFERFTEGKTLAVTDYSLDRVRLVYPAARIGNGEYDEFYSGIPEKIFVGKPMFTADQLIDFAPKYGWAENVMNRRDENADENSYILPIGQFLEYLGNPYIPELYKRAKYLSQSPDLVAEASPKRGWSSEDPALYCQDRRTDYYTGINYYDVYIDYQRYDESGFTFDSFYKFWADTYVQPYVDSVFGPGHSYCEYNGELYFILATKVTFSGTKCNYQILQNDDEAVRFRYDEYFSHDEGFNIENREDFDYWMSTYEFSFVNTEYGWRTEYFERAPTE